MKDLELWFDTNHAAKKLSLQNSGRAEWFVNDTAAYKKIMEYFIFATMYTYVVV